MGQKETDIPFVSWLWDVPAAVVLLTRLPLPALPDHAFGHAARSVWAYPLVGLILGCLIAVLGAVLSSLGVPAVFVAGLCLCALIALTGAMHEDGLADMADGLWGGFDPARRLDIMKDSRIGAYGVLALILALGLRWLGFAAVPWEGLITALVVSRGMMAPLMLALPHARTSGLSHRTGTPELGSVVIGFLIAVICAVALSGGAGLVSIFVAALVAVSIAAIAKAKIGGQTGDILGATQVTSEIAVLIVLVSMAA